MNKSVVLLAGKGESTDIIFHSLSKEFNVVKVIEEEPVDQMTFLKKRIKKLGLLKVIGQVLFKLFVVKYLDLVSKDRIRTIKEQYHLMDSPIAPEHKLNVSSVNSAESIKVLQELNPNVIVVNGTRIISKKVLESVTATFINTHAGITPLYRGVHGGYWALASQDAPNCGVTVHLVDAGIDTGNILGQALIYPTERDNFITYPLLQLAAGLPLLKEAVHNALAGRLSIKDNPKGKSNLWYHPTLVEYLRNRLRLGVN